MPPSSSCSPCLVLRGREDGAMRGREHGAVRRREDGAVRGRTWDGPERGRSSSVCPGLSTWHLLTTT